METDNLNIGASPARRIFLLACFGLLGVLLVWLGFAATGAGFILQAGLVLFGALVLAMLPRFYRSGSKTLALTPQGLVDSDGLVICEIANIASVERGTFAFRPSNGFLIRLRISGPLAWEPGMWWRIGTRLGVGGILNASQTKLMADLLSARIHHDS